MDDSIFKHPEGRGGGGRGGQGGRQKFWRGRGGGFNRFQGGGGGAGNPNIPKGEAVPVNVIYDDIWRHYLSAEDFRDASLQMKIPIAKKFIEKHVKLRDEKNPGFEVDYDILISDQELLRQWPEIKEDIGSSAGKIMGLFGYASISLEKRQKPIIRRARLINFRESVHIDHLRAANVGQLIHIRGTAIRVTNAAQMCTWLTFECEKCESDCVVEQKQRGKYTRPQKCPSGDGCRSQSFVPKRNCPSTWSIKKQSIILQEMDSNNSRPSTIECHLTNDLTDAVVPGDVIDVIAVVKVTADPDPRNKGDKKAGGDNIFMVYLDVLSIDNGAQNQDDKSQVSFTMLEMKSIAEIFDMGKEIFRLLVHSLCPPIYGHEMVKAGLLLALFGGTSKFSNDKDNVAVRGDPHILIVGDPGLGKSQMLTASHHVAPRSVFVTATGASNTGLTVSLSRGPGNEFVLEAGALVMADQGCCFIDEFDKVTNQHPALLEAMEQQTISLAKCGVSCSLSARTAILAAANPVDGHYNKAKTVTENLKMKPALISRFDLLFILIDRPDEYKDAMLSDHIMNIHNGVKSVSSIASTSSISNQASSKSNEYVSLIDSLKLKPNEDIDVLPHEIMEKYIAYARRYVKPKLNPEANSRLMDYYLELRRNYAIETPITTRKLESLIRLTQARAKCELRTEATVQDAEDVIEIMKFSMFDSFSDGITTSDLDLSLSQIGSGGKSQGSLKKKFVAALDKIARRNNSDILEIEQMKQIAMQLGIENFKNVLESLNEQGYLLKRSAKTYKLLSN